MNHLRRCVEILDLARARDSIQTADAVAQLPGTPGRVPVRRAIKALVGAKLLRRVGEGVDTRYEAEDPIKVSQELGEAELIGLQIGARSLAFLKGTELPGWSEHALIGVLRRSSSAVVARLQRVDARFRVLWEPPRTFDGGADRLANILDALRHTHRLRLKYGGRDHGAFEPLALVMYRRALYLLGRDAGRSEVRRLAFDRLEDVVRLRIGFSYPSVEEFDLDAELAPWFGIRKGPLPAPVHLRFHPRVAHYVLARQWHATAHATTGADGWVDLRMDVGGDELVRFVLEWGETARVVEPAWLRDRVVRELRAALQHYETSRPDSPDHYSPVRGPTRAASLDPKPLPRRKP